MATTWQDIIDAAATLLARWKRDINFTSQIVNGPATGPGSTVATDGGTISTFQKTLYDFGGFGFPGTLADTTDPTKGDALVGVKQPFAGAVAQTQHVINAQVVSVKNFGAVGDGIADDTAAVGFAWAYATATGKKLWFPAGTYNLATLAVSLDPASNLCVFGDGMDNTLIKFNNTSGLPLFAHSTTPISNVEFRDIAIDGGHGEGGDYTQIGSYPFLLSQVTGAKFNRVKITRSRTMAMAIRSSFDVDVSNCVIQYAARDGINTAGCNYVRICDNRIEFCDDDAIGAHSQIYDVVDRGYVITGNLIRFSQGIKALGAVSMAITGNTIEFVMGQGISVQSIAYTGGAIEGINAGVGVTIAGNTVKNCIDRAIVDGLNTTCPYISIGGAAGQAGALAAIPGENVTGTATVISPYPYFGNTKNADPTQPIPGNYMFVVNGNTMVRDIPDSGLLSALGYGIFYTRTGPKDCTLTTAAVRQNGIIFQNGITKGVVAGSNTFMGIGAAVSLAATAKLVDVLIHSSVIYDCSNALAASGSNTGNHGCIFSNNIIDLDPFMLSSNRGANGTFLALGGPTALTVQNARGFSIVGNTFRNLGRISDFNPLSAANLTGNGLLILRNIVECDPAAFDFSTSNKGVGQVPRGSDAFIIRIVDSDPGSATYGNVLNNCPIESSAMPAAGKFVVGHFVKNYAPTVAGAGGSQYIVFGWIRTTTGSAHVLNTDWREARTLTGT